MSKKSFIDSVEVKSPCSEDWNKMSGTDKIRFCSHCSTSVNNLSEMTRKQATRLVRASNGQLCIRYIPNPVTKRPMFAEQLLQITRRAPSVAAGVMTASIALSSQMYAQGQIRPTPPLNTVVVVNDRTEPVPESQAKVENTISTRTIVELPISTMTATMGMVAITRIEYKNSLTRAVLSEDKDALLELIQNGVSVNGKESDKSTPLFHAIETGNIEIVEILLRFGASVNARDSIKQTPIMRLDHDATPALVELLVRYGAKIDVADKEGNTTLILATGNATAEVVKALIDAGADTRAKNKQGRTALMEAADSDDLEAVKLLLEAGSDVNARDKEGDSAWDLTSNDEIEKLLETYGAETTDDDEDETVIPIATPER